MKLNVEHQQEKERFAANINAEEAELSYEQPSTNVLDFTRTFVPEKHRGQGIASELVRQALEIVREKKLKVIPTCPFVKNYIEKHTGQYSNIITEHYK